MVVLHPQGTVFIGKKIKNKFSHTQQALIQLLMVHAQATPEGSFGSIANSNQNNEFCVFLQYFKGLQG